MRQFEYSDYFARVASTLDKLDTKSVERLADTLLLAREEERTIFIFGNGGSAATASHVTGDFLKGISYQMSKRFRVQCLNDNLSAVMAISNDLAYTEVFIEQLKAFLRKGDVVIGISGSGNSENVVRALAYARSLEAITVAFCGFNGGKVKDLADILIHAPIHDMEVTEDVHIVVFHALKQALISRLKGDGYTMGELYDKRIKEQ